MGHKKAKKRTKHPDVDQHPHDGPTSNDCVLCGLPDCPGHPDIEDEPVPKPSWAERLKNWLAGW